MSLLFRALLLLVLLSSSLLTLRFGVAEEETASAPGAPLLASPFPCEQNFPVSQGNHGRTHNGWGKYAWDFSTPVGAPIVSPVAGEVIRVRDDSIRYGCDPSFGWDGNYILISIDEETDLLLLHLEANSARVEVGDQVDIGTPLAKVGNSGWVCGTHLHVQVQRRCNTWWCPSLPASFEGGKNPGRGEFVLSTSCEVPVENEEGLLSLLLGRITPRRYLQQ